LLIYLITLTGNLLILLLIFTDSHLHTPMYFFLGTLACLDMSLSSVTVPRMLFDLLRERRIISVPACITQVFFFFFFCTSEVFLLAVMSCDRYVAICRPLHYMQIMSWKVCVQLVLILLVIAAAYSLLQTLFLTKLRFCRPDALQSFFCDLPQLLQVSCSDTFINVLLIFLFGIFAAFFNYFRSYSNDHYSGDKVASVVYAILTPFVNPMIYSLRNQELKSSLKKSFARSGNPNWTKTGL
ncbi:olfactory receptor 3-like, partial [Xenopus tropicalis]|uniref:Olfactory receptor n=1 Tax=Xenopus tropicalis TaxID=8364 RepID=A0A8J1IYW6_XENTR